MIRSFLIFTEEDCANYDKDGRPDPNGSLRKEMEAQDLVKRSWDEALSTKGLPTENSDND